MTDANIPPTTDETVDRVAALITLMLENYPVETTGFDERAYLNDLGVFTLAHHLTGALVSKFHIIPREAP